jgi:hypothetical protein
VAQIHTVRDLHGQLVLRGVDCQPRLAQLSAATGWQMPALLDDCLAYPQRLPRLRDADGIRHSLRCNLCGGAERPTDARVFLFCDACLRRVIEAVRHHTPISGIILFRTYNAECRCAHADSDTVLVGEDQSHVEEVYGVCEKCLLDETQRRDSARLGAGPNGIPADPPSVI